MTGIAERLRSRAAYLRKRTDGVYFEALARDIDEAADLIDRPTPAGEGRTIEQQSEAAADAVGVTIHSDMREYVVAAAAYALRAAVPPVGADPYMEAIAAGCYPLSDPPPVGAGKPVAWQDIASARVKAHGHRPDSLNDLARVAQRLGARGTEEEIEAALAAVPPVGAGRPVAERLREAGRELFNVALEISSLAAPVSVTPDAIAVLREARAFIVDYCLADHLHDADKKAALAQIDAVLSAQDGVKP